MASKRDLMIKKRRIEQTAAADEPDLGENPPKRPTKKRRRRRPRSLLWLILFRLLLVAALVMLGVLLWKNWDRLAPEALSEWMDTVVTGGEGGDGYPVTISGSHVVAMRPVGSYAALLTDTSLLMYNTRGGEVVSRGHTYADPLLDTAGNYALVAEIGGSRYTLNTKKEVVYSGQAQNTILGASVADNGQVALATESSQSYMSEVVVFDRGGQELFHWYSVDLTVVDVAMSPNGKRVAVLGLSAENGVMKSSLLIFQLSGNQTTAVSSYSASGAMMGALHYYGNGRVAVVGDSAAWVYDTNEGTAAVTTYDNALLVGYAFSTRGMGIVTSGFGESSGGTLTIISSTGEQTASIDFSGDFRHVAEADNGFYLLTSDTLYLVDTKSIVRQMAAPADGLQVVEMNGRPLLLSLTALTRCEWP